MTIPIETTLKKMDSDNSMMEEKNLAPNDDPDTMEDHNSDKNNIDSGDENSENSILSDCEMEGNSDSGEENLGNSGWADAMSKVLNTNVKKSRNFILSKAKKDTDLKVKDKCQEIELVDDSGNVTSVKKSDPKPKIKTLKQKRKEMIERQKQKAAWESMCRVKPDITNKEKDRELIRIATRGIVHLFNTVEKHQKNMKKPPEKKTKKKDSLGEVKGSFMDILKGHSKKQQDLQDDPVTKKVKHEETWSILKDDFMMGAEMKDWDKESDIE